MEASFFNKTNCTDVNSSNFAWILLVQSQDEKAQVLKKASKTGQTDDQQQNFQNFGCDRWQDPESLRWWGGKGKSNKVNFPTFKYKGDKQKLLKGIFITTEMTMARILLIGPANHVDSYVFYF
jgi:hypothetical protein